MNFIKEYSGVIALVILAIVGVMGLESKAMFGSATSCTDGYTCFTNLEVQGNQITDGTSGFSSLITADAGILQSYTNSTSTAATSQTLIVSDVQGYNTVIVNPTTGNDTLTFFASSTATSWLPTAGDMQHTCFINGTTTADIYLTIAGGTGTKVQVASSSVSALGSLKIGPQKAGCFDFVRGNSTATTFDILALFTAYQ